MHIKHINYIALVLDFGWPTDSSSIFDDDLTSLLKHLPAGATPLFLRKLGISADKEGDDLEQKLKFWRDQNIKESKSQSLQNLVLIHRDAMNKTNDSHGNYLKINILLIIPVSFKVF